MLGGMPQSLIPIRGSHCQASTEGRTPRSGNQTTHAHTQTNTRTDTHTDKQTNRQTNTQTRTQQPTNTYNQKQTNKQTEPDTLTKTRTHVFVKFSAYTCFHNFVISSFPTHGRVIF